MDVMVALYPFKAQNDTELSFAKGDRLEVLDRPASDPEWFKVSLSCGSGSSRIRNGTGMLGAVLGIRDIWCGSGSADPASDLDLTPDPAGSNSGSDSFL